ncbi:glycoside hydrolase family 13 protein [Salisediminibacterium halotolerans]|uniref:glycoside hydrolase family 13 protein n=1 Tax=Salisediminibacterium halotolerans TaxID=517425 RepID=UPI000EB01320|nr:alpha-glucosidase [Salisediminibacterium halotolerans]RLJ78344.1 oligo-1,6-glucosidase [Actinophytocola xinjiangensis]RPE88314.1 oligo-glucosidase [Salisediminibacterium halotolerans]TWG37320.1 oligo-1,6-glucosidase [Salisediminibacterium halotolerans]GEL06785.1 oligo-1,6-glucosidase [Salisediminibacterium halotolerans]
MAETKRWWKESVVYQIYPRSFNDSNGDGIGDIPGITEKLDYLKTLGIDVIWLSPVYKSPNDDNGYDISDYKDIMDEFGTMADWETMLAEAHKRGLKVIMDLVVNHSSDEHAWFLESRQAKDNPYRDYYIWRPGKEDGSEPNNWESAFSGSAWEYDEKTGEYYLHLFSKKQPDLNWENPTVRSEVHDMMKWWLDKGVDGFRMDVINFISKEPGLPDAPNPHGRKYVPGGDYFMNGPRIHEFLHEMYNEVLRHYDVMTVGEMPGVDEKEAIKYTDETREELNMVFQFEHVDLDSGPEGKWDIRPLKLEALRENLVKWQKALEHNGWNSLYWNNHDQPRVVSRFGNDGDYHYQSATMLATLLHMMKGTPYIYQGEEFGMTNVSFTDIADYNDIETLNMYHEKRAEGVPHDELMEKIHIKGRDNARTPVQWDDSQHAGFTSGEPWLKVNPNYPEVNAEAALNDPKSIFYYYQKLIELRHNNETVVYGSFDLLMEDDPEVFAYKRELGDEMLLVYCNFYNGEPDVALPKELIGRERELFLANREDAPTDLDTFTLRPYEAVVYRIR